MRLVLCIAILVLVMGMCLLPASAIVPDNILLSTNKPWIVANGYDTSAISVYAYNTSIAGPVNGAIVTFSANNTLITSFTPSENTTIGGSASSSAKAGLQSGTAIITTRIFYREDDANLSEPLKMKEESIEQFIDHDTPYLIPAGGVILPPNGEAPVGSSVLVGIQMKDAHGNLIDNRREAWENREAEKVRFSVTGSPSDTGHYTPEGIMNVTRQVNATGWAIATYRMDERPGPNILKFEPLTSVPDIKRTILGTATGIPFYLYSEVYPADYVLADGESTFFIVYTVEDEFHNGLQLKDISINSSLGEHNIFTTNATGNLGITYGPKSDIGDVVMDAFTLENTSVSVSNLLRFVNLTANEMVFTAAPQSMASYDAKEELSTLRGLVIDSEGNPITGESILFTITNVWYEGIYNITQQPGLRNGTVQNVNSVWQNTDENGIATVFLKPCSFTFDESAENYTAFATGHCTVNAEWTNPNGTHVTRPLDFTFKNYPYLSAETSVSSTKVNVTGTVDVSLWLKGDGFLLTPKPVDVILVLDRSGSMGRNYVDDGSGHSITRMAAAKISAKSFVDQMNASLNDRIGLISYSYENSVSTNAALGTGFTTIKTRIDGLSADGGTAMRPAIKQAIDHMRSNWNPDPRAIHAIVVMTDGNWNNGGSPLAVGKGYDKTSWVQSYRVSSSAYYGFSSLANHFEDLDYRWYNGLGGTISGPYNNDPTVTRPLVIDESTGEITGSRQYTNRNNAYYCTDGQFTNQNMSIYASNYGIALYTISFAQNIPQSERDGLTTLAEATGGFYRHAPTTQELTSIFHEIAGNLRKQAGINTNAVMDFQNIEVKNVTVPGAEVFTYHYLPSVSTFVKRWKTGSPPFYQATIDDTPNWTANHSINYYIGTMEVRDNWMSTFRLQVLQEGDIHIFGANSLITFDDGKTLHIPDTVITAIPNLVNETYNSSVFTEENVNVIQITDTLFEWNWTRTYTGEYPLQEFYYISLDGGYQWTLVGERSLPPEIARTETQGVFRYDIKNLLPYGAGMQGITVDFKLKAYALDAPSPRAPRGPPIPLLPASNVSLITLL